MADFPTGLDTLKSDWANATPVVDDHPTEHNLAATAVEALEAKVGINSSAVTTSHDYKLSGVAGADVAASLTGTETLTNKTLTLPTIASITNSGTVTLPTGVDTIVGRASTDTLTNKSIDGDTNTITDIDASTSLKTGTAVAIANGGTGATAQTAAFDALSPTTTKGDIVVDNGTNDVRLAVSTDGYVLAADSTETEGVKWDAISNLAGGKIVTDTTEVTVGNSNTETTLFTTTIAGGTLSTNNAIRFKLWISDMDATGSGNFDLRIKYGSTTMTASTMLEEGVLDDTNFAGWLEGYLVADGSTSAQKCATTMILNQNNSEIDEDTTVHLSKVMVSSSGTAVEDSTGDLSLAVTWEWDDISVNNSITAEFWVVEKIA